MLHFRLRVQMDEAFGPVNRWYCSQAFGKPVDDPCTLLTYFIKSGGASNFASRFNEAMGPANRWFCSEYYHREVSEPEVLWDYYKSHTLPAMSMAI